MIKSRTISYVPVITVFLVSATLIYVLNPAALNFSGTDVFAVHGAGLGLFLLGIMLTTSLRKYLIYALYGFWGALIGTTLLTGAANWNSPGIPFRVSLFTGSPNLLAAGIVISSVLVANVMQGKRFVSLSMLISLALVALVFTGSRTAMIVFILCSCVTLVRQLPVRLAWGLIFLLSAMLVYVALAVRQEVPMSSANMLQYSDRLDANVWEKSYARDLELDRRAAGSTVYYHITGSSNEQARFPNMIMFQRTTIGESEKQYVASAYLRADADASIVLSNNIDSITCTISRDWQRCATPASYGNNRTEVHFQLLTVAPGSRIDIEMRGPQVEEASFPSPYSSSNESYIEWLLEVSGAKRFYGRWASDDNLQSRIDAYLVAIGQFREKPIFGQGFNSFPGATQFYGGISTPLAHAHNAALHALATQGLVGFIALMLPFGAIIHVTRQYNTSKRIVVVLLALLLLNATDYSYYTAVVYYPFWLGVGILATNQAKAQVSR